ncbi:MAG: CHAT domain-containing tetratricopeptide repeat protein [Planctomycetota bacterium]|nr:CHAT domain-containing tetratricopeptide repeat protein [Planctomycetota bacterium]
MRTSAERCTGALSAALSMLLPALFAVVLLGDFVLAQSQAAQKFRAELNAAKNAYVRITGKPDQRVSDRVAAVAALDALTRASALIEHLSKERVGVAKFGVEVWRSMVYWRLGREPDLKKAVEIGLQARQRAHSAGSYGGFYRALLLVVLWNSMGTDFLDLLDDPLGDGGYLRDAGAMGARQQLETKEGWREMVWSLRILLADIDLTVRPDQAVGQLRELALELSNLRERLDLRDECNSRLAWHFVEMREFERAKIFLDSLPQEASRYPRAVIAYKTEDFEYAAAEARELRKGGRPRDYLLYANAIERQAAEAVDEDLRRKLYIQAKQAYTETINICRTTRGADKTVMFSTYGGLGDSHLGLGELDAAEKMFERALTGLKGNPSWVAQAETGEIWKEQGRLAERRGDAATALAKFLAALDQVEDVRAKIPLDRLGIAWLEKSLMEAVDGVLRLAVAGEAAPLQALAAVDRMKARGLLDWMGGRPTAKDLKQFRDALRAMTTAETVADVQASRMRLESLRATVHGKREVRPLALAQVRELLAANTSTTFLSFWVGKNLEQRRVYLIAARGADHVSVYDLGEGHQGHALFRKARKAVARGVGDPWPDLDAASEFFLPEPVRALLPAGATVVVSVDSEIGSLPVEALRLDGEPLGSSREVYRAPSLAVFARLADRSVRSGRAMIVDSAEPSESDTKVHGLTELSFSAAEAEQVGRWHRDAIRLHRADATLANLRDQLASNGDVHLLHISCHAVSHAGIPSASLLMLTDGPVDMATLATLALEDSLVVFSTCMSAGGERAGGEGVKGLLWGPLSAGARAVVASHWQMNQQATKDLMGQFHRHLASGVNEGEAMRLARASLAAAKNYAHPSYWAGFGVYGVPHEGVAAAAPALGWVFGAGLLLGVLAVFAVALWISFTLSTRSRRGLA